MRTSALLLAGWLGCVNLALAADRPNIILILADDLGYGDVGCYGQKLVPTRTTTTPTSCDAIPRR
jgi:hypothetical protein